MNPEIIEKTCACGANFTCQREEWRFHEPTACAPCTARIAEEKREREEAAAAEELRSLVERAERAIDKVTPPRFRATDPRRPEFNLPLWRKVEAWKPTDDRPWLGLIGSTGTCKTRSAFLRMKSILVETATTMRLEFRPSVDVINGPDFGTLVLQKFSDDRTAGRTASARISEMSKAQLLLFDELGKVRGTPAIVEMLFAVLDYRHARNLVTLWTSNRAPDEFCQGWPEEYAGPLGGRIIECSTIIQS